MRILFLSAILLSVSSMSFGQSNYKKTDNIEGVRAIESTAFRGHYLSVDSRTWHGEGSQGGGIVNVLNRIGTHQLFKITKLSDGTYSIASTFFKNRFLRMDGSAINASSKAPGGVVNLQDKVASYEKFKIKKLADGSFSIESVAFPGRFLTLNPNPRASKPNDAGGRVQVQNRAGGHERFNLLEKQ